nr:putative late blight resistance protein homolog R1B-14 [Ipomoea batatas]
MAYAAVLLLQQGLEDLQHLMTDKWSESDLERVKSGVCFMEGILKASDPEKMKAFEEWASNLDSLSTLMFMRSYLRFDVNRTLPEDSVFSFTNFKVLRVLDISFHPFDHFPEEILQLKFLRYLALASFSYIPSSVDALCFLQTLIRYSHEEDLDLPLSIWHLKQLRHLCFKKSSYFPIPANSTNSPERAQPTLSSFTEEYLCLRNLQTLSNISLTSCTRLVLSGIPNLKKLGVRETKDECENDEEMLDHLSNVKFLVKLETLKCFFIKARPLPQYDSFPPNLKKLTLRGCHRPWEEMTVLAALPNLEVLKLKYYAFEGPEWEMTEGFDRLKFLVIDGSDLMEWEASSFHFPNLQSLVLRFCNHLIEIPGDVGEINTLETIELCECSDAAYNSAKKIQLEQQDLGNEGLTVRICQHYNCE